MRMQGRRVIITGGSSGIGLETARLFLAEGARVALLDLDGGAAAAASLGQGAASQGAAGFACDVTSEASVAKAVEAAGAALGGVDGLVNSAGVSLWRPLAETSFEDWRRVHAIDLDGPFLVTREALPLLRAAGGGTIVNLASGAGMRPLPNLGAYCSAKAGLVMLSRALALEFAGENIRVNAVAPGPIHTPMLERTLSRVPDREAKMQEFLSRVGMRRLGTAEEVAKAILFLSCAESSFTTGAVIEVDGGRVQI
ncbi:SDR family oxidoreductase [Roseococcus sp. SYP-B2431]|uniref:SDR family NAD(P)-dependent oxidoreductase n=1 Tax=Roseococcus sp. SYP-B2431 TaxID=2496640 RepID=UPI00104039FF|nr:SDR family oxidoreductase [Roseococcus sp. SYP-B2431]TCH98240.1 SDR family oxidoreductase [Roseococcus sp. SYP-B2431]